MSSDKREDMIAVEAGSGASLFVRRPVFAIVVSLLILLAGAAAFMGIEVRELPNIDRPVVTVRTNYPGATPETIDKELTAIIEGAVARTPGVISINSRSEAGQSRVTVEFSEAIDINVAANDLRDAIGNLRDLPEEADPPTIVKADADSDAIMRLVATSATMTVQDLTRVVEDVVIDRLASVEGVADVQVYGDRAPLVRVLIDPNALAARGLTVLDLRTALSTVALDAPAGRVSDLNRTMQVRADASAKSAEEIAAIRINPSTRVGDVADVIFGPAEKETTLRLNDDVGVGMGIVRQANSNTLDISTGVRAAVDEMNAALPEDITIQVTSDDAVFIDGAIHEVLLTLFLATSIVVAVIYLFLRSAKTTFIPAVTVPIALIGTLAAMWLAGFSINILTLLALVLATGMVVDDAIVVIENITRMRGLGLGPRAAAVLGTKQVFFAILATTATLVAVFVPISFFPGVAGRLFSEFGFVLAFAVALSGFVALTLCPMLASRLIGRDEMAESRSVVGRRIEAFGERLATFYERSLNAALAAPMVVIAISLVFAGAAMVAYGIVPEELSPPEDRGVVAVSVNTPQGSTVDYTEQQMRVVEAMARPLVESGEAENIFAITRQGGNGGFMLLTLAPWDDRERSQMEITQELNRQLQTIPGTQVFARSSNSLGIRGGGQGVQFAITGLNYADLSAVADAVQDAMETDPTFDQVQLNYDTTQAQLSLDIDRERASDLGVSVDSITSAVRTLLGGDDLGDFYIGDDPIEIRAQAPDGTIQDASALDSIQLRTADGAMVPLSSFVSFTENAVAPGLPRQDQRRAIPMSATLAEGVDMRTAIERVSAITAEHLEPGMAVSFSGEARELDTTSSGMVQTFAFALLVVLLVLAAQFESFNSAFILIATVPFGLAAAIFAILLSGGSLNIYSQIGLVMLVGLMSKNGILIVEFANQLRDEGQSVHDAIRNACRIRLRPVIMTMVSTVLGGLPLILTTGPGAEAREALGWVIVGGLGFATVFTLYLTPVVFSLMARFSKPRAAEEQRLADELAAARALTAKPGDRPLAPVEEGGYRVAAE